MQKSEKRSASGKRPRAYPLQYLH